MADARVELRVEDAPVAQPRDGIGLGVHEPFEVACGHGHEPPEAIVAIGGTDGPGDLDHVPRLRLRLQEDEQPRGLACGCQAELPSRGDRLDEGGTAWLSRRSSSSTASAAKSPILLPRET